MATTAWKSPSANSVFNPVGAAWTNPSNAYADDGNNATADVTNPPWSGISEKHLWSGFAFSTSDIPTGSTIDGIEVRIEVDHTGVDAVNWLDVQLHSGATALGSAERQDADAQSPTVYTYGGATDTFGSSITDSQVRAADFGVIIDCDINQFDYAGIDYIEVRVHYTLPVSGDPAPFDTLPGTPNFDEAQGFTGGNTVANNLPATFAFRNVDVPATPSGILLEDGAGGSGLGIAFSTSPAKLYAGAGNGSNTTSTTNTVFAEVDVASFAGTTVNIYVSIDTGNPSRMKIYVFDASDHSFITMGWGESTGAFTNWRGGNPCGVGVANNIRAMPGTGTTGSFNGTMNDGAQAYQDWLPSDFSDNTFTSTSEHDLTITDIESSTEVSGPTLTSEYTLSVSDIESSVEVDTPSLSVVSDITITDIESSTEVDSPALTVNHQLSVSDIEAITEISTPSLSVVNVISATDIESLVQISEPSLTSSYDLTVTDIETAAEVDTPSLSVANQISVSDLEVTVELTSPSVGITHNLTVEDLEVTAELDTPGLSGSAVEFTGDNLQVTVEVGSPGLVVSHNITVTDIESGTEVSSPSIAYISELTATSIESATEVSEPSLAYISELTTENLTVTTELTAPGLTSVVGLTGNDLQTTVEITTPQVDTSNVITAESLEVTTQISVPQLGVVITPVELDYDRVVYVPAIYNDVIIVSPKPKRFTTHISNTLDTINIPSRSKKDSVRIRNTRDTINIRKR